MLIFFKELVGTASRVGLYFFSLFAFDSSGVLIFFHLVIRGIAPLLDNRLRLGLAKVERSFEFAK